jgi:hypothetical protein
MPPRVGQPDIKVGDVAAPRYSRSRLRWRLSPRLHRRPTTSRHLSPCDAGAGRYDLATTEKDGATYDLARTERDTVRTWRSMKMRSR